LIRKGGVFQVGDAWDEPGKNKKKPNQGDHSGVPIGGKRSGSAKEKKMRKLGFLLGVRPIIPENIDL